MPDKDLDRLELEEAEQAGEELPEGEPRTVGERLARSAPWWGISGFLHLVVAVICMYILALIPVVKPDEVIVIKPPTAPPEQKVTKIDKTPTPQPLDKPVRTDKPLHFKAPEDVTTETPNDQEFEKAMGESLEALTERPFKGVSTNDSIGGGAGGAGKYGGRLGGNKLRAANSGGGGDKTEDVVLKALRWLSRHQSPDGSWEATKHTANCGRVAKLPGLCTPNPGADTFQVGLTGLSLLAFLGAGYTHLSRDVYDGICFGDVVKKGVQYLMRIQDPSGRVTPDDVPKYMYNHLLAAFAGAPVDVHPRPPQYGVEPGSQVGARSKSGKRAKRAQVSLLHEVLGVARVAGEAQRGGMQGLQVGDGLRLEAIGQFQSRTRGPSDLGDRSASSSYSRKGLRRSRRSA